MSAVMGLRDGLGKWKLNIHGHRSCAGRLAGPTDDEDGKPRIKTVFHGLSTKYGHMPKER